jgi:hypothetical protein
MGWGQWCSFTVKFTVYIWRNALAAWLLYGLHHIWSNVCHSITNINYFQN